MNNYKKIILNNGLTLYLNTDPSLRQTYVSYSIHYGSNGRWFNFNLDGKDYHVLPGMAHYLEHLLGERSISGNMYTNFSRRHQSSNAYTGDDYTCYYFRGIENINESAKDLLEAMENPIFDDKMVNQTRHAICEEATSCVDNYPVIASNLVEHELFGGFDKFYKTLTTIGNRETTELITTEDLYACYNAFYTKNRESMVISGNVNEEKMVDFLNNVIEKLPTNNHLVTLPSLDYSSIRHRDTIIDRPVNDDINGIGFKAMVPDSLKRIDVQIAFNLLFSKVLGNDSLFLKECQDEGLLDTYGYCDYGFIDKYFIFSLTYYGNDRKEFSKRFIDELNNKNITEEEFILLKRESLSRIIRGLDKKYSTPRNFTRRIPYTEEYSDKDYILNLTYDRFIEIINSLDFTNYVETVVREKKR